MFNGKMSRLVISWLAKVKNFGLAISEQIRDCRITKKTSICPPTHVSIVKFVGIYKHILREIDHFSVHERYLSNLFLKMEYIIIFAIRIDFWFNFPLQLLQGRLMNVVFVFVKFKYSVVHPRWQSRVGISTEEVFFLYLA